METKTYSESCPKCVAEKLYEAHETELIDDHGTVEQAWSCSECRAEGTDCYSVDFTCTVIES